MSRCLSSCMVTAADLKRCQGDAGHSGPHYWIEARRDDGKRLVARWRGADAARADVVEELAP